MSPAPSFVVEIPPGACPIDAEERETSIRVESDGLARIFTASAKLARRFIRAGATPTREDRCNGRAVYWWFTVPEAMIHLGPPKRYRMTEARRRALQEGGRRLRNLRGPLRNREEIPPVKG